MIYPNPGCICNRLLYYLPGGICAKTCVEAYVRAQMNEVENVTQR